MYHQAINAINSGERVTTQTLMDLKSVFDLCCRKGMCMQGTRDDYKVNPDVHEQSIPQPQNVDHHVANAVTEQVKHLFCCTCIHGFYISVKYIYYAQ